MIKTFIKRKVEKIRREGQAMKRLEVWFENSSNSLNKILRLLIASGGEVPRVGGKE